MPTLTAGEIARATGGVLVAGNPSVPFTSFSTDTRSLRPGDFFFPLRGEKFDGHDFLHDARARGARGLVSHRDVEDLRLFDVAILVKDTTYALQELARHVRKSNNMTVVGITGTTGKTSTKDFTAALLGPRALKSEGNLNNLYGLPVSLLRVTGRETYAVLEMGMSTPGEIRRLCEIASPSVGVVTNVSPVHMETMKTLGNVARAKAELLEALPAGGLAVVNGDDPWVMRIARRFSGRILRYGYHGANRYRAGNVRILGAGGMTFTLMVGKTRYPARARIIGKHALANLLAAVAVADGLGVPIRTILGRMKRIRPVLLRGEVLRLRNGAIVLNDAYNSNPRAMEAAVEMLRMYPCRRRRILVAGDMLELGAKSRQYHLDAGRMVGRSRLSTLLTVGKQAVLFAQGARRAGFRGEIQSFDNAVQVGEFLKGYLANGDVVVIKGSRGIATERAISVLTGGV
ncbi:MAG: UDP-N-acetylmuramoyl-tripeptide--D-alanyl-D-alanine ligase [Acidobacteriota bacterium]